MQRQQQWQQTGAAAGLGAQQVNKLEASSTALTQHAMHLALNLSAFCPLL